MSTFDLSKLLTDVFVPSAGEVCLILYDEPHGEMADLSDWAERRAMAPTWHAAMGELGCEMLPLTAFPATGTNNGDLPSELAPLIEQANIVIAMTEFSATAPLSAYAKQRSDLRIASMPGVQSRMQETSLAADYTQVARRAHLLKDLLQAGELATIRFSTGDSCVFDLCGGKAEADDGYCGADKEGFPLINLPSGEAFVVPNEGSDSRTAGRIPVENSVFIVEANQIVRVEGEQSEMWNAYFGEDDARRNVAELGLGCNDMAIVTGNVLEDEKAGLHWAFGRSEHLGGTVGPDAFRSPATVVHQDIVYARHCPVEIAELRIDETLVIRDSDYVLEGY